MEDIVLPNTGRTEVIFDVFVSDPLVVDQYIYRCWLQGFDGKPWNEKKRRNKSRDLSFSFWSTISCASLSFISHWWSSYSFSFFSYHIFFPILTPAVFSLVYSEAEAAIKKQPFIPAQFQVHFKTWGLLLLSEVHDQYRNFRLLVSLIPLSPLFLTILLSFTHKLHHPSFFIIFNNEFNYHFRSITSCIPAVQDLMPFSRSRHKLIRWW